jgi:non-specific serine/threonine protein kinase
VEVAGPYDIGRFQVRPDERRVYVDGRAATPGARAFDLLLALIERRDRVVAKDELLALVWPGVVVEEGNLSVHVSALRKLLGDDAIATVAGRGYRFTAAVTAPASPAGDAPAVPSASLEPSAYEQLMLKLRGPAVAAEDDRAGHVPAAMTPLVGRAAALEQTLRLLQSTRCLTLSGAGGAGKTRLALALAEACRPSYPGGVWWVELHGLSDPQMLTATVAHAVGATDAHQTPLQSLTQRFKGRRALLVLDNCEHLIDACATLAAQLLRELPLLRLLTTSREALRIAGEVQWSVPPLEVPADASSLSWDELLRIDSVKLLAQSIGRHDPQFTLLPEHATSLSRICRGLEGLPLALELVAAQVGVQTLDQIASRLDRSLPLLNVGRRDGMDHHRTMAAAVQWGFRLLGPTEAAVFLRLSVFAGGWVPDGAYAVCSDLGIDAADMPPLLANLHRVSMVQAQESDGAMRFRMLEPIRQFASARLDELGLAGPVRQQLLAWYVGRCKAVAGQLVGAQQAQGYAFLIAEFDNLRALLSWSLQGDLERGLRLAADLWRFWQVKGHAKEMLHWFDEALARAVAVAPQVRADAFNAAGVMARTCGRYEQAIQLHGASLELQRELGNRRGEAVALNNLCVVARDQYDHVAVEAHGRASLQIAQEIGDRHLEALGLMHLGTALRGQDRPDEAEQSFKHSYEIFEQLGEQRALATLLNFRGNLALARGRSSEAERYFEQSLELNQSLGDYWGLGISMANQASLQFAAGDEGAALRKLTQSFAHDRRAGAKHGVEECFELLAQISQKLGRLERAAWCWGVVERLEQDIGKVQPLDRKALRDQALRTLSAQMPAALFEVARATGRQDPLEQSLLAVSPAEDGLG